MPFLAPRQSEIVRQLHSITKKWITSGDDVTRINDLLRELARLDGYRAPSTSVTGGWLEERWYGLEELARLEIPEAVEIIVSLSKRSLGLPVRQAAFLLSTMNHSAATVGLRKLYFGADSWDSDYIRDILKGA